MVTVYRYIFSSELPLEEIEATLILAIVGAEALHGETALQLASCYELNSVERNCVVDAETPAGHDLNRLFAGFLLREFGPSSFDIRRTAAEIPLQQ